MAVEEVGTVWIAPYALSGEMLQQKEESRIALTEDSLAPVNREIKLQKLMYLVRYCEPRRCETFKDTKDLSSAYTIALEPPFIRIRAISPHKYFITGFSLYVEGSGEVEINIWGEPRRFTVQKQRELLLGLTLKETLQCFVEDEEILLIVKSLSNPILPASLKIYGIEFSQSDSVYRRAYAQLHRLVTLHFLYDDRNLMHYL